MQNTRQKNHKCFIEVRHCLITLIEKYSRIENCRTFGALLTNLSKAFNCLSHELLFANWMQMDQAKSIMQMQINSSQSLMLKTKSKKKNIYSSRGEMLFGVPQDPILRSSLFNILICEMFFFLEPLIMPNVLAVLPHIMREKVEYYFQLLLNSSSTFNYNFNYNHHF